jgi:WD40 repeat protein
VHHIALPQPTVHAPVTNSHVYDVFLTAATDGVVNIWDLRMQTIAGRYTGHVNRREEHIKANVSPCMRYFSVGSEDRAGRIVDLRKMNNELARLMPQHRDVVTEVAFNPLFAQCVSVSYDGVCKFFVDPLSAEKIY